MTSALRWAAMRAILIFHNCEEQSHKTVFTDHNFWSERRAKADLNQDPSAYTASWSVTTYVLAREPGHSWLLFLELFHCWPHMDMPGWGCAPQWISTKLRAFDCWSPVPHFWFSLVILHASGRPPLSYMYGKKIQYISKIILSYCCKIIFSVYCVTGSSQSGYVCDVHLIFIYCIVLQDWAKVTIFMKFNYCIVLQDWAKVAILMMFIYSIVLQDQVRLTIFMMFIYSIVLQDWAKVTILMMLIYSIVLQDQVRLTIFMMFIDCIV